MTFWRRGCELKPIAAELEFDDGADGTGVGVAESSGGVGDYWGFATKIADNVRAVGVRLPDEALERIDRTVGGVVAG